MSLGTIVAGLLPASLVLASPTPQQLKPAPSGIYNGEEVGYCEWPQVVAMRQFGAIRCTSTLISPRVVLTARHCLEAIGGPSTTDFEFVFGEHSDNAQRVVTPQMCRSHPSNDLGFCVLPDPITDTQFIPPIVGCEQEELFAGQEITILGFGSTWASQNDEGWDVVEGAGPKRKTFQDLEKIEGDTVYLLGNDTGGCPGDSGGPAVVRLSDGTWRTLGAAWAIHPDTPPVPQGENVCGYGTLYTYVATNLEWIEEESGQDVTPCNDANGVWNPGPRCQSFPLEPGIGLGAWGNGCWSPEVSGLGATCGAPWDGTPPEPEPPEPEPPEPPEPEPPEPEPPEPVPPDPSTGTSGPSDPYSTETGFGDEVGSPFDGIQPHTGCQCDGDGEPRPLGGLVFGLFLVWRRRR